MRIFVTIPHYFSPTTAAAHGSTGPDPEPRIAALSHCLRALYATFAGPQQRWSQSGTQLAPQPANTHQPFQLDLHICTLADAHLLDRIHLPRPLFTHHTVQCAPRMLGFACHALLRDHLDAYDYYVYLEDDLILHDPAFFAKLSWFNRLGGDGRLLQPNRYEVVSANMTVAKNYIDFEFAPSLAALHRAADPMQGSFLDSTVVFRPPTNPHAGCFFLNRRQMRFWATRDYFLDQDTSFVGPLESAATRGIQRTFQIYKPAAEQANFLEVEHYGQSWSRKLTRVRIPTR